LGDDGLEKLDSIKRWLAEIKTEESRRQYLRDMGIFIKWAKLSPDDLLRERAKNLISSNPVDRLRAKDRLMKFFIEAPFAESSKSHTIAALKSFYRANGMALSMRTPKAKRVRERDYIPTREDIQKMVQASNKRDAAMIMVQAQTGLRVGALVSLQWKHISDDFDFPSLAPRQTPTKIIIPGAITQPGVTFILNDASYHLRCWLVGKQLEPETFIFDIGEAAAMRMVKQAAIKTNVIENEKGLSQFRSHCFRKRVQTILESTHIEIPSQDINGTMPLNWVDLLLDHIPRGSQGRAYSRPSEEELRQAYFFTVPRLRVF